jgi:hypothetical protein
MQWALPVLVATVSWQAGVVVLGMTFVGLLARLAMEWQRRKTLLALTLSAANTPCGTVVSYDTGYFDLSATVRVGHAATGPANLPRAGDRSEPSP